MNKGNGIDARNWGAVGILTHELDPEVQWRELSQYGAAQAQDDPSFFEDILANPKGYKNFCIEDKLVFLRDGGRKLLCVPSVLVNGRNVRDIVISRGHSLLAHLGLISRRIFCMITSGGRLFCWTCRNTAILA